MDTTQARMPRMSSSGHALRRIAIPVTAYEATHLLPPGLRIRKPVIPTDTWGLLCVRAQNLNCTTERLGIWYFLYIISTQDTTIVKRLRSLPYILGYTSIIKLRHSLCTSLVPTTVRKSSAPLPMAPHQARPTPNLVTPAPSSPTR